MNIVEGNMQKDSDRRILKDRRKQPTPALSRFSFFGRRKMIRREADLAKIVYVDRYSSTLFFFLILIVGLNILDSLFTMMIMDLGGEELNPFVRSVIELHGDLFWIWKFAIVSISLILLCLHRGYKLVRGIVIAISSIYLMIVLYQVLLLTRI
jgi:hypothetical protein